MANNSGTITPDYSLVRPSDKAWLTDSDQIGYESGNLAQSLKDVVDSKQDKLSAGTGIKIENNVISATGGGGGGGNVDDVKVNGTSVVTNKVANIDLSGKVTSNNTGGNTDIVADNVKIKCSTNGEIRLQAGSGGTIIFDSPNVYVGNYAVVTMNQTASTKGNGVMSKEDKVALDKVVKDVEDNEYVVSTALNALNEQIETLKLQINALCQGSTIYGFITQNELTVGKGTLKFISGGITPTTICIASVDEQGHYSISLEAKKYNVQYVSENGSASILKTITLVNGIHQENINF